MTVMEHSSSRIISSGINAILILLLGCIGQEINALDSGLEMMSQGMDMSNSENTLNSLKRAPGQLWFGPRLGRKKRNEEDEDEQLDRILNNEENIIEFIRESPWALIPLKGNVQTSYTRNFTPRLGRDSEEIERSPPFHPRLGRRRKMLPFSPRLGRDLIPRPEDRFTRSIPTQPDVEVKH